MAPPGPADDVESPLPPSDPSSLRIDDCLLRALPPTDIIQDDTLLSLGTSLGVAVSAGDTDDSSEGAEPIFETSFDLTQERLRHVFSSFDTDADGKIDYDSLKRGLKEWQQHAGMQISALEGRTFTTLVSFLDSDNSGDITFEEFSEGFRLLMLRALLPQRPQQPSSDDDEGAPLEVLDYDATRLEQTKVGGGSDSIRMEDFFFHRRDDWVKNRWVDVATTGISENAVALTMKRLAVKYLLHPLALEDALETDVHRPKVEAFSSHYFLIIPLFYLERAASPTGKNYNDGSVELPRKWYQNVCSCCKSKFGRAAEERLLYRRPRPSLVRVDMISIFVNVPRNDTIITCNQGCGSSSSSVSFNARSCLWQRVQQELKKPYSKLRQYDAQYLTYALLDQSVDLLVPIIKTMRREIACEREHLRRTDFARGLRRIHDIRTNLEKICRTIKPFLRVLTHVIEDGAICPGVTVYLRDVLDNLECADDDLRHLIEQCEALDADADKYQDRQMNRTLYMLTIISAIFLPAQFLTGVWGMNFIDMPELNTSWGYEMFWIITASMTCLLLALFCIFGRLRNYED